MSYSITLTEEEIDLLEELLRSELGSIRSEHRRTRNPEFRGAVEHRKELEQRVLDMIERARSCAVAAERVHTFPG